MNQDSQKIEMIEQYLQNHRRFLLTDVAAATGIAIFDVQQNLDLLLEKYDCRLQVSEKGEIIYDFADLTRRGERKFAEYLKIAQQWLWEAFKVFFRLWIAVTLVVYFLVFLVIIIAVIIMFLVAGDGDGDIDVGDGFGSVFGDLFTGIFQWHTVENTTYSTTDSRGYDYKRYEAKSSMSARMKRKLNGKNKKENKTEPTNTEIIQKPSIEKVEKGFTACIYDFVFGEPRYEKPIWFDQQEIASFLRENKGIITLSELKALNGLPKNEAENMFSDCLFRFEGKAEVSENGVLYADFSNFVRKVNNNQGVPIEFYWNEYEAPYEITGNTIWTNTWVIGLNLFNLCCSVVGIGIGADPEFDLGAWVEIGLGWIPFSFSALFFAIPVLRSLTLIAPSIRRRKSNIRKRLMKVIFANEGRNMTLEEITAQVNSEKTLENLDQNTVEEHLKDLVHDLEAERGIDKKSNLVYAFDRVEKDLKTAQKLRQERLNDDSMQIMFDSKE